MSDEPSAHSSKRVRVGSVRITVYAWTHPGSGKLSWQFQWRDLDGRIRKTTRRDQKAAIAAAREKALEIHNGRAALLSGTKERTRILEAIAELEPTWADVELLRAQRQHAMVPLGEAREAFLRDAGRRRRGRADGRYQRDVQAILGRLVANLGPERPIREITKEELAGWIDRQDVGWKRARDIRASIVALWRLACAERWVDAPGGKTVADRIPAPQRPPHAGVRFLSPGEMERLLDAVASEFLPWMVLGGFSGLRTEEIHPGRTGKPALGWEHVRREAGHIEVPAAISKVGIRRLVPILQTLEAWLSHIGPPDSGPIVPRSPSDGETLRLAPLVFDGPWPRNCLRHSYGSHRAALLRDLPRVADEMGTSPAIISRHYREAVPEAEAASYFALVP